MAQVRSWTRHMRKGGRNGALAARRRLAKRNRIIGRPSLVVVACQNQSGPSSVRWAQPTNLQHIARDLVGCDHELFCNPANRNSTCFTTHQCFFSPDGIEGLTSEEYTQTLLRPFIKNPRTCTTSTMAYCTKSAVRRHQTPFLNWKPTL